MLIALEKNGKKISSDQAMKGKSYTCPTCHQEVILKKGKIKIPHFAHKTITTCDSYSESESAEHLSGKYLLAKNCERFGLHYELEAYIPKINQRADILVENYLVIEFQCSPLSIERLRERTRAYQLSGYEVFWVLGGTLRYTRTMTELKKHLLYFNDVDSYYHMELDVKQNQLGIRRYMTKVNNKVKQQFISYSLNEHSCFCILKREIPLISYQISCEVSISELVKQQLKWQKQLYLRQARVLKIQEFFYHHQANLLSLPVHIYFPRLTHPFIEEWEYILRFVISQSLKKAGALSYKELFNLCLETLVDDYPFSFICLPDFQVIDYCLSLYLVYLQHIGFIRKESSTYIWQVKKSSDQKMIEKSLKMKVESLSLPLKYDMIDK